KASNVRTRRFRARRLEGVCGHDRPQPQARLAQDPSELASPTETTSNRECLVMALLYGPAARCKPKMIDLGKLVLRFCIRPTDGAFELLAIMDHPRAFDLIRDSAPKARRAT